MPWMNVMPRRWSWLVVLVAVGLALLVHVQADPVLMGWSGLPAWVLLFILLQGALTVLAAWMARP